MSNWVAEAAGFAGSVGLAAILIGVDRRVRLVGLAVWAAGLGLLGLFLLPDLSNARLVVAAAAGIAVAVGGGWVFLRWPWALAFSILACIPLRLPVDIGDEEVNLLVPLYAFVGAVAVALGWSLLRGDGRSRELGPVAFPLAGFVLWSGLSILWADDVRRGAIFLGAFLLSFPLLALGIARLPWRGRWLTWMWSGLVATALAYALVGGYQWFTREVFWNPSVIVFNAYAPFFRVNSIFWDPSVYGRYLAVALLASISGIVLGGVHGWRIVGLYAVVVSTWLGLVISFSQSSYVALIAGTVVAAGVAWGRKASLALLGLAAATLAVAFAVPQIRSEVMGKSRSGVNKITSGRSNLVGQGMRIAADHPVIGVGVGGFPREYGRRVGIGGHDPKRVASHTTPITVATEGGVPGLALYLWLVAAALLATLRGLGRGFTSRVSLAVGVALVAIAVHSLFYSDFFEDPMTWALLGFVGLVARVPRKPVREDAPEVGARGDAFAPDAMTTAT